MLICITEISVLWEKEKGKKITPYMFRKSLITTQIYTQVILREEHGYQGLTVKEPAV